MTAQPLPDDSAVPPAPESRAEQPTPAEPSSPVASSAQAEQASQAEQESPVAPRAQGDHASPIERALETLTPRRARTRSRLMDAAYTVFARDGINGASIEVICEAAGFTRGAFYSNFESKEELCLALAERLNRRQLKALETAARSLDPVSESGTVDRNAIAHVLSAINADGVDEARRWTMLRAELELLAMRDARVAELLAAHEAAVRSEVRDVIARILDTLGLRFVLDDAAALDLLFAVHESCARQEAINHPSPGTQPPTGLTSAHDPLGDMVNLMVTTAK